jgi:hypothetical protein
LESIEPGSGIEILSPGNELGQDGSMDVAHDYEPKGGFPKQKLARHLGLACCGTSELLFIDSMVTQERAEGIHHAKPEVGVYQAVDGGCGRMLNHSMNQPRLPPRLPEPIAVNCSHLTLADLERGAMRLEPNPEISVPEIRIPPIVVSPYHNDRDLAAEPS